MIGALPAPAAAGRPADGAGADTAAFGYVRLGCLRAENRDLVTARLVVAPQGPAAAGEAALQSGETGDEREFGDAAAIRSAADPTAADPARVGRELIAAARDFGRAEGRSRLVVSAVDRPGTRARYAALHDGRPVYTAVFSELDLAAVDRAQFAAWAAAAPANAGYRVVRWTDRCPQDLVQPYVAALRSMADSPQEEFAYESPGYDPERLRAEEEHLVSSGARRHLVAAVAEDGSVAGMTTYVLYDGEPAGVEIWDTCVVAAHRGRGLGLRLKAEATLWMLRDAPGARRVRTYNSQANTHMLAVNRRLGYRAAGREEVYEFRLLTLVVGPGGGGARPCGAPSARAGPVPPVLPTAPGRSTAAGAPGAASAVPAPDGNYPGGTSHAVFREGRRGLAQEQPVRVGRGRLRRGRLHRRGRGGARQQGPAGAGAALHRGRVGRLHRGGAGRRVRPVTCGPARRDRARRDPGRLAAPRSGGPAGWTVRDPVRSRCAGRTVPTGRRSDNRPARSKVAAEMS